MPSSGTSLSIAAWRLPQWGQKPRFASPSRVSYQVGSLSPVQVTVSKPTHHITGVPPSFWQCWQAHRWGRRPAPEERSASWRTAEQSILALYDQKVAAIFGKSARDEQNFSITKWLTEGGTVFLIGEEDEGSSLAPILAAFSRAILDTAKVIAARMPNGRLDPPLALLGDELANVAPLPQIPSLMSVSGSQNIFMVAVLQNLAQAHERWGELGVRKMFAAATIKVILGGVSDEQELKSYSQLAGEFEEDTESVSDDGDRASISISTRRRAVLEPGDIRQIKEREGLVVHRRTPVTRVKFERIHEGPRAREISEATKEALKKVNSRASSD